MPIVRSRKLSAFPEIIHGSSTRGGSQTFFRQLKIKPETTIYPITAHSSKIQIVHRDDLGKKLENTDGLITQTPQLFLTLYTADCIPLFFYVPVRKIVALVHAGWLGTLQEIAQKTVFVLQRKFKVKPQEIIAYLGPGIGVCCYHNAHHPERIRAFSQKFGPRVIQGDCLDLKKTNVLQLEKVGVPEIEVSPHCTCCAAHLFPSHRREGKKRKESNVHIIGLE